MSGDAVAGIRPEKQLLLCCARTRLDAASLGRIEALVSNRLDWPYLLAAAAENGITPFVYRHLQTVCPERVPPVWMEQLRQEFHRNTANSLYLSAGLLKILDAFAIHEILAIPYKGPVLAEQAYGNLNFRQFADLDIVVRQRDIARVHELLHSQSYRARFPLTPAGQAASNRIPGQYVFTHSAAGNIVEIHTERTLRYFPVPLDLDALAARRQPVELGGRRVLTFSAEDALPILCVHGCKHFWERLCWICDIAELAQHPRGINWEAAFEQSRRLGAERMLLLGLHLAANLLETPLPEEVLRRVREDGEVERLGVLVRRQFCDESRGQPGLAQRVWFRVRMRGKAWQGVRYCLRLATAPTEEDWTRVNLAAPFSPLYAVLRPFRVLRKYGLGIARLGGPQR